MALMINLLEQSNSNLKDMQWKMNPDGTVKEFTQEQMLAAEGIALPTDPNDDAQVTEFNTKVTAFAEAKLWSRDRMTANAKEYEIMNSTTTTKNKQKLVVITINYGGKPKVVTFRYPAKQNRVRAIKGGTCLVCIIPNGHWSSYWSVSEDKNTAFQQVDRVGGAFKVLDVMQSQAVMEKAAIAAEANSLVIQGSDAGNTLEVNSSADM